MRLRDRGRLLSANTGAQKHLLSIIEGKVMWTVLGPETMKSLIRVVVRWWQGLFMAPGDRHAGNAAGDAVLLRRRMSRLGIDADVVARLEPALFGNLQTLCLACGQSKVCRHDLSHDLAGGAWDEYCPNAVVLNALSALCRFRADKTRSARSTMG
jgi:hypothetical protein